MAGKIPGIFGRLIFYWTDLKHFYSLPVVPSAAFNNETTAKEQGLGYPMSREMDAFSGKL